MADNKDDMSDVIVTFEDDDGQGAGDGDDEDAIIAKIITNAEGEEEYVAPTEEEFAAAEKAYNALVDENESM